MQLGITHLSQKANKIFVRAFNACLGMAIHIIRKCEYSGLIYTTVANIKLVIWVEIKKVRNPKLPKRTTLYLLLERQLGSA